MLINCVCNSILRRRRWYVRSNDVRYWKLKINEQSRNEPLTWIIVRVNISRVSQTLFILHSVSTRHNISIFSPCSSWKVFAFGYLKLKFMPTNERTKNRKVACWWIRSNISIRFNECFVSFPAPISSSFTAFFSVFHSEKLHTISIVSLSRKWQWRRSETFCREQAVWNGMLTGLCIYTQPPHTIILFVVWQKNERANKRKKLIAHAIEYLLENCV